MYSDICKTNFYITDGVKTSKTASGDLTIYTDTAFSMTLYFTDVQYLVVELKIIVCGLEQISASSSLAHEETL